MAFSRAKSLPCIAKSEPELATLLKGLHDTDEKLYAGVVDVLTKANAAVSESGVFAEVGTDTTGGESIEKLDTVAKKAMEEDKSLTYDQAVDKCLREDSSLYAEYENQKG